MLPPNKWSVRKLADVGTDEVFVRETVELKAFRVSYPAAPANLEDYLREVRKLWQNDLAQFRNGFLEHQEGSRQDHMKFYDPNFVEGLFAAAARIIADILVMLMNLQLPPRFHIVEHDDKIHGPGGPNRFRVVIEGFAEMVSAAQKPSEQP